MFYYQRQIGDYAAATRHLSLLEHGVYAIMLDAYYLNESPLPADMGKLCRLIGARSHDEIEAVRVVSAEFFTANDSVLVQKRCDAEIAKYHEKSDKAKVSANARWAKSEGNADAMRTHSERNAKAMLTKNQEPITDKKIKRSLPDGFGVSEAVEQWAKEKGYSRLQERLEHFVGYAKAKGAKYVNWDQAFMNAIRADWAKLPNEPAQQARYQTPEQIKLNAYLDSIEPKTHDLIG